MGDTLWTIDQLAEAVGRAFVVQAPDQRSGRVREVPDKRTIRYYTTLGILDRPAEMRGRTAYYSRRHLAQIVAIKRLQSAGQSLVEVQTKLAGADQATLEQWAQLPEVLPAVEESASNESAEGTPAVGVMSTPVEESPAPRRSAAARLQTAFWAAPVEPPPPSEALVESRQAIHLALAPGVTLVLEGPAAEQLERLSADQRSQQLAEAARAIRDAWKLDSPSSRDSSDDLDRIV